MDRKNCSVSFFDECAPVRSSCLIAPLCLTEKGKIKFTRALKMWILLCSSRRETLGSNCGASRTSGVNGVFERELYSRLKRQVCRNCTGTANARSRRSLVQAGEVVVSLLHRWLLRRLRGSLQFCSHGWLHSCTAGRRAGCA